MLSVRLTSRVSHSLGSSCRLEDFDVRMLINIGGQMARVDYSLEHCRLRK